MSATDTGIQAGNNQSVVGDKEDLSSSESAPRDSSRRRVIAPSVNNKTRHSQQQKQPVRPGYSKKITTNGTKSPRQSQQTPKAVTSSYRPRPTSVAPSLSSPPQSGTTMLAIEHDKNSTPSMTIRALLEKSDLQICQSEAIDKVAARNDGSPSDLSSSSSTDNEFHANSINQIQMINKNRNVGLTGRSSDEQSRNNQTIGRYRPQKYCAVCGDKAIACNFNAVTCESCKAFFRRNAFKEQRLKCLFDNRCVIDKVTRRFCSKCRLLKCFQIGMKRQWILTDEQKQMKRVKIMQNKQSKQHQHVTTSCSLVSNTMSSSDTPSVGSNRSRSNDSPSNFTHRFREQPSVEMIKRTSVENQQSVHVGDEKPRLSSLRNDDNYHLKPQKRDASTSCPDENDLMSGRVGHYCSMAYSCQYCSLRLTPGIGQHLHQVSNEQSHHPSYLHQARQHQYDYHERQQHYQNHQQLQPQHYYQHQQQQDLSINHNYQSNSQTQASSVQAQIPSSSGSQLSQHQIAANVAQSVIVHTDANYFTVMPTKHEQVSGSASSGHQMSTMQTNCQHGQRSRVETPQIQICCCESTTDTATRDGSNDCSSQRSQSSFDRANHQAYVSQSPQFHMMEPSQMQKKAPQSSVRTSIAESPRAFSFYDTNNNTSLQQHQQPHQHQNQQYQQASLNPSPAYRSSNSFVLAVGGHSSSLGLQLPSQTAGSVSGGASVGSPLAIRPALQSSGQGDSKWEKSCCEEEYTGEICSEGVEDPTSTSVEEISPRPPIVSQVDELEPSMDTDQQQQNQHEPVRVSASKPSHELVSLSDSLKSKANIFFWKGEPYMSPAITQDEMKSRIENVDFSDTERQLVYEMLDATRLMFDPSNVDRQFNETLDDFVHLCDSSLRCLIKTVKQINAFRILGMDDQIMLLKTACFKILLLRSCLYYNEEIGGWLDKHGKVMPLNLLKTAKSSVYEKHKDVLNLMACPLRNDRIIMGFMSLVLLFDPSTTIKHSNSVGLDNLIYLCVLRKYLIGTQPDPLAKYERLVEAARRVNICNEEYNVFFSKNFQPEQITPLLIEIFDISINSPV